jgi:transposase
MMAPSASAPTPLKAERSLRGTALGKKPWFFAGSDRGGERAAVLYSFNMTAKMNNIDPQAWLADVLALKEAAALRRWWPDQWRR